MDPASSVQDRPAPETDFQPVLRWRSVTGDLDDFIFFEDYGILAEEKKE